jgi:adenosine deaminase
VQTFAALHLSTQHAWTLAHNSIEASFAPDTDKQRWTHALKQTFERFVEHDD